MMKEKLLKVFPNNALIVVSFLTIVLVYIFIGIYFENDNALVSYLFHASSLHANPHLQFYEEFFLVDHPISYLQQVFPRVNVYGMFMFLSSILLVYVILKLFISFNIKAIYKYVLLSVLLLLVLENLVLLNNVKISFIYCITAMLYIWSSTKGRHIKTENVMIYSLLLFVAISARFQISLIALGFSFIAALLFADNRLKLLAGITFVIVGILFSLYLFYSKDFPQNIQDFHKYELAVYDRNDLVITQIYENPDTEQLIQEMDKGELIIFAKALFLKDDPILKNIKMEEIILHPNTIDYIFHNEAFIKTYSFKLKELVFETFDMYKFLLILNVIIALFWFSKINRIDSLKLLLFISIYLSLPFLISIIGVVPSKFMNVYLIGPPITFIILEYQRIIDNKIQLFIIVSLSIGNFFNSSIPKINSKLQEDKLALEIHASFLKDKNQGKTSYVSYSDNTSIYPSNILFSNHPIPYYFVDLTGYIDYPAISHLNQAHYGTGVNSIVKRYQFIRDTKGIIYSSPFMINFIENYFKKVHHLEIQFILLNDERVLNQYKILSIRSI